MPGESREHERTGGQTGAGNRQRRYQSFAFTRQIQPDDDAQRQRGARNRVRRASSTPGVASDTTAPPRHIAIIMDGNGRWAKIRGLPRVMGHSSGVEAVRRTVKAAIELQIPYLTLYSFSSENWSRPAAEISELLGLMKRFIRRDLAELHKYNVRIHVIGERDNIEPELRGMILETEQLTAANTGLCLIIAFNYGSRTEITSAARKLCKRALDGEIGIDEITAEALSSELDTDGIPDPDLLIRTSGESRLSNFLLWQCAYAELVFIPEYWPDFSRDLLQGAIEEYANRERRFGGLAPESNV